MVKNLEKINSFSYIRAVACIAVVLLHTVASASMLYNAQQSSLQMLVSNALQHSLMWAVPCFVMVTGALLLDPARDLSYRKLFGKYILRVVLALALFCFVFRIFSMVMDHEAFHPAVLLDVIIQMLTAGSWSHLWYLYLLIGLYLLLPFYKKVAEHSSDTDLKYLLGVYFIFLSILPLLQKWNLSIGFYIHVATIYPFYLFCGYALHKGTLAIGKWAGGCMFLFSTIAMIMVTLVFQNSRPEIPEALAGYSTVIVILQAVGLFSFLDQNSGALSWCKRILLAIDRDSFSIYLVHMIFVRLFLRYLGYNPYRTASPLRFLGLFVIIFLLSLGLSRLLKLIPGLKKIL